MIMVELGKILIIGIVITTSNQDGRSLEDIPKLWEQFYAQSLPNLIPNKVNDKVYAVYTNYQGDFTAPYDLIIGCEVSSVDQVPVGMKAITILPERYQKFQVGPGNPQEALAQTWMDIWSSGLNRSYTADFELYEYDEAQKLEVAVYVAVKE